MSTAFLYVTMALFAFVCVFMILLVLVQKGRGGGLAGAFGGMGGNTAFGSKTGDVLTWVTASTFALFVALAIVLNLWINYRNAPKTVTAAAGTPAAAAAQATPNTPAPTNVNQSPTTAPAAAGAQSSTPAPTPVTTGPAAATTQP